MVSATSIENATSKGGEKNGTSETVGSRGGWSRPSGIYLDRFARRLGFLGGNQEYEHWQRISGWLDKSDELCG